MVDSEKKERIEPWPFNILEADEAEERIAELIELDAALPCSCRASAACAAFEEGADCFGVTDFLTAAS
jgi:hypothetical protein